MRFRKRWSERDSLAAVARLDRALRLDERVLTAWEILGRGKDTAAERLVLAEAEKGLEGADPRALFRREFSWPAALTPVLLLAWFVAAGLDRVAQPPAGRAGALPPLAQRLKETARALEERAKGEGLTETLEMARALDEIARKMEGGASESEAGKSLRALGQKIEERVSARRSGLDWSEVADEKLAEWNGRLNSMEATRPQSPGAAHDLAERLLEGLASLPGLGPESQKALSQSDKMNEAELQSLLAQWAREILAELDRRSLEEMKQLLALMTPGDEGRMARGERKEEAARGDQEALRSKAGESAGEEKGGGPGTLPGDEPGRKNFPTPPPSFRAEAASHLRGLIQEGEASGLALKGRPEVGTGRASKREEEVLASYRRQAEEEIASEEIPEALRETVKRYFLSLGMGEK
jgi:hypothetical protein